MRFIATLPFHGYYLTIKTIKETKRISLLEFSYRTYVRLSVRYLSFPKAVFRAARARGCLFRK